MVSERTVLVLWDVDHTLVENGGVSRENYALAFELLTGRPALVPPVTGGRTDLAIVADLLTANGENVNDFPVAQRLDALIDAGRRNADVLRRRGHALPGAASCLAWVGGHPDVIQSVLTGNVEANARLKLAAFGLDGFVDFSVGGFGDVSPDRARLVPAAQARAAAKYGFDPVSCPTVLIGDTPRDVQAGLDGGARVIGLATGESSVSELQDAGADAVLPGLADENALWAAIAGVRALGPATSRFQEATS